MAKAMSLRLDGVNQECRMHQRVCIVFRRTAAHQKLPGGTLVGMGTGVTVKLRSQRPPTSRARDTNLTRLSGQYYR